MVLHLAATASEKVSHSVRRAASLTSPICGTLGESTTLTVMDVKNGWGKLHPTMYSILAGRPQFVDFDVEEEGWTLLGNGTDTTWMLTSSSLGAEQSSPDSPRGAPSEGASSGSDGREASSSGTLLKSLKDFWMKMPRANAKFFLYPDRNGPQPPAGQRDILLRLQVSDGSLHIPGSDPVPGHTDGGVPHLG